LPAGVVAVGDPEMLIATVLMSRGSTADAAAAAASGDAAGEAAAETSN
jgi:hypothetical protein